MQTAVKKTVGIHQLVDGLKAISDADFSCKNVYSFLGENPVDIDSITKYYHWSSENYTRNLVYKDKRFEVMVICWEKGVASRVHDHADQKCWMMVPVGKLKGQNFAVAEIDEAKNYCRLVETDDFELSDCLAATVELEAPIHQVLNPAAYDERAVSIHIYSKPYDSCLSYCRDTDTFKEVQLFYTSVDGTLCEGITL